MRLGRIPRAALSGGSAAGQGCRAGAAPALEVVDWKDARLDLASIAASSSFHAGFVVGELRGFDRLPSLAEGWPVLRRGEDVLAAPDPSLVPVQLAAREPVLAQFSTAPLGLATVLHVVPRTQVLGALLVTAYLGGATATHVRVAEPCWFPILLGVLLLLFPGVLG